MLCVQSISTLKSTLISIEFNPQSGKCLLVWQNGHDGYVHVGSGLKGQLGYKCYSKLFTLPTLRYPIS